jgi:hypothetical protein
MLVSLFLMEYYQEGSKLKNPLPQKIAATVLSTTEFGLNNLEQLKAFYEEIALTNYIYNL